MKISGDVAQKVVGIGGVVCGAVGLVCNLLSGKANEAALDKAIDKKLAERENKEEN